MDLTRGDIVTVAAPGDFGKPRPALVLQARIYPDSELVTVALITSDLIWRINTRLPLAPSATNGLRVPSAIMVDNVQTFRRSKIGRTIGQADQATLRRVNAALVLFFGLEL